MDYSILVQDFIEQIWNNQSFEKLDNFLHQEYKDYSLLPILSPDKHGTQKWIVLTGKSFEHQTIIESQVTSNDESMVRIKMKLKHIGVWRGIEPTGLEIYTIGFRHFKIKNNKIIEHWALIDGQTIENQLKETAHGCKING
ncbi:ester cyclase [Pelobium sp.]|nr:ester cyclase [Pelobium sp.]MDA9554812.1 ester cyclase [Pelobium sp.]